MVEASVRIQKALGIIGKIKDDTQTMKDLESEEGMFEKASCTGFSFCSAIYPFTTENIAGYYSELNFKNKKVLTVCGSGDHVLNAILLGAKEIDCFDINMFAFVHFDLKRAAIKALTYEEFCDFFINPKKRLNIRLYSKVYKYLLPESKMFWDSLYLEFSGLEISNSYLFDDLVDKKYIKSPNLYLRKKGYEKLKGIIDKCEVKFINCDIVDLYNFCENTYDFIGLSNIYGRAFPYNQIKMEAAILKLIEKLNENGIIILNYSWSDNERSTFDYIRSKINDPKNIGKIVFNDDSSAEKNNVSVYRRVL